MHHSIKISEEDQLEVIKMYQNGITYREMKEKFGASYEALSGCLKRNGIEILGHERHRIKVNDNWLDKIDTEEKAYFLGFMYADGCVHGKREIPNVISISIQYRDIELLERFKSLLSFEGKVRKIKVGKNALRGLGKKAENVQDQCSLRINSKNLVEKLIENGCVSRKTYCLKWPTNLREDLYKHFMRGYIDGDGFIWPGNEKSCASVGILGTEDFCLGFKSKAYELLKVNFSIGKASGTEVVKRGCMTGSNQFLLFCQWLYKDATIYLSRKKDKYFEGIKNIERKRGKPIPSIIHLGFRGSSVGVSKLTEEEVILIRKLHSEGSSNKELSIKYKVVESTINAIVKRKTWKHI